MGVPSREASSFHKSSASVLLDLIRGLAAILVLVSHWKIMFFVDYQKIPSHRIWFALPYVFAAAGHQAVLIFFILSGYLISGGVFRSLDRGTWQWSSYLTHRFVRLWIVLLPGLLIGGFWDWLGLHLHRAAILYSTANPKTYALDISQNLTASIFIGNLAFLQTVLVSVFGSNGALWSLANEFWYYLLFPLGCLAIRRDTGNRTPIIRRVLYLALFLLIAWFVRSSLLALFPVWLAGTLLALLPPPRVGPRTRAITAALYLFVLLLSTKIHPLPELAQDYLVATFTVLFFWVVLSARHAAADSTFTRFSRHIARFSYTLYVVHMPIFLLLTALIAGAQRWSPTDLRHHAIALAVLAVVVVYAWLIASLTEFHTEHVRAWVEDRLGISASHRAKPL